MSQERGDEIEPKNERWLGLRSYGENHSDSFYGRDREIEELFQLVERETLITVFAPSGTGKTSLLQAGLFPKLRESGFLPIRIRLNHSKAGIDHRKWFRQKIEEAIADQPGIEIDEVVACQAENEDEELLWEYMHRIDVWDEHNQLLTPVVVLDQFEEIFTIGKRRKQSDEFLRALGDLAEKRMPDELRERLGGRPNEIPMDIQRFRIVLALREDFVAHLDRLRKQMPSVMRNRYGLRQMTGEQAMDVVLGPGKDIVDESVAREIVEIAAKADGDEGEWDGDFENLTVEPNLLSLLCAELDRRRREQGEEKFAPGNLEEVVKNILRKFYDDSFKGIKRPARDFVEDYLVDVRGYRESWKVSEAEEKGLDPVSRKILLDRYILRPVDERDAPQIELAHDLLTGPAQESRERRTERIENVKLRLARRKAWAVTTVLSVLICVAGVAVFTAYRAKKSAVKSAAASTNLVNFMTNDLYDRLLPIGRVDILDSVAERAQMHFVTEAGANSHVSESELATRANVMSKIGNVLTRRGDIVEAIKAHQNAIGLIEGLSPLTALVTDINTLETNNAIASMKIDYATLLADWIAPTPALKACGEALSLTNDESIVSRIRLAEARAHLASGNRDAAFRALELTGEPPLVMGAVRAEFRRARAVGHRISGEIPLAFKEARAALSLYNQLTREEPGNDEWKHRKANVLRELGNLHLSIGDADGAKDKMLPALAIVDNRLKRGAAIRGDEKNLQWKHLAATLSNDLARVWMRKARDHPNSGPKGELSKLQGTARAYLDRGSELLGEVISKDGDKPNPKTSLVFEKIFCENLRISGELLAGEGDDDEAIKKFEWGLKRLSLISLDSVETLLTESDFLWRIAQWRENSPREHVLPPAEFEAAIAKLDQALQMEPLHRFALKKKGDILADIAAAHQRRGQASQAIDKLRTVLKIREEFSALAGDTLGSQRESAKAAHSLADYLAASEHAADAQSEALQFFSRAAKQFILLKGDGFLRVQDRLASGRSHFGKGLLHEKKGESEIAEFEFRRASDLGFREATLKLPHKEKLANRQKRVEHSLPCVFRDELLGDLGMSVERRVFSTVLITADSGESENPIHEEILRLKHDLMLEIEPSVLKEIEKRHRLLQHNPGARLSLAAISDVALTNRKNDLTAGNRSRREQLNLHSPVSEQYPKRVPTVIGSECWLNWSYAGTADDLLEFQLQVSTEKEFARGTVFIDETVNGTRFRCNFREGKRDKYLNRELFWRVRQIPGLEADQGEAGIWSLTQKLEVYDSIWDRILQTGVVRVGVSEFEGDLLDIDNIDNKVEKKKDTSNDEMAPVRPKWGGFDGNVLDLTWEKLNSKYQNERDRNGDAAIKPLKFKLYVYGWDGMFEAVSRNEVDFSLSSITRTKEREERFGLRFTEPYFETKLAIVYRTLPSGKPLAKIADARNLKLAANEGLRGAEVGLLIVGKDKLQLQSEANLPKLIKKIQDFECDGAITDVAYLHRAVEEDKIDFEGLALLPLNSAHYDELLDIALTEQLSQTAIKDIEKMQSDFGRAEWEQYAIATSETDRSDRVLLRHLNEIILNMRKNGDILRFCRDGDELPIPTRILGPSQKLEEIRRLATVIPTSPVELSGLKKGLKTRPTVMGNTIQFSWQPIGEEEPETTKYLLQIARPDTRNTRADSFDRDVLVFSENISGTNFTFNPSKHGLDSGGLFYWRAKRLENLPDDDFPLDGWCNSVAFEYYKDCPHRICETGKLLIGVNVTNGFSVFRDPVTNERRGFDIEIAAQIANLLAKEYEMERINTEFVEMNFSSMLPAVKSRQVDFAISGITRLKQRERDYDVRFSIPYARTWQAAIWPRERPYRTVDGLIGKKFVVFEETRAYDIANLFGGEIASARNTVKAFLLERISNGNADATVTDYPTAIKLIQDYRSKDGQAVGHKKFAVGPIFRRHLESINIIETGEDDLFTDEYGIPMRNDQHSLVESVNRAIDSLQRERPEVLERIFQDNVKYNHEHFRERPFQPIKIGAN